MDTINTLAAIRQYFDTGTTLSCQYRIEQLKKLQAAIQKYEQEIYAALYKDLKKSPEECWVTENGMVLSELNYAIKNVSSWMKAKRVATNLLNLPSSSKIMKEPLGVVLIIAPWNYPFQLLLNPLIGAIAAGNCVVLKPSEFAAATEAVMKKMIEETFEQDYIFYATGDGATVIPAMMDTFRFDHIFYTGSTAVGKNIYQMAAEKLTPVTLELGGKSPCIVESDADIKVAARRIAMTKFSNCGQICVAPDYVLVHQSVKEELIKELKIATAQFYGVDAAKNDSYGKIINARQFDRIVNYLKDGTLVYGGNHNREQLYIQPTILDNVLPTASIMQEEIFGPVLPVLSFNTTAEAKQIINLHKNPLAFYVFTSSNKKGAEWLDSVPFGGGCVNNATLHLTNHRLPFGGRGYSGMGAYHGRTSFDTFSHQKSVMQSPTWFDPSVKYPPYNGKLKLFKWIVR